MKTQDDLKEIAKVIRRWLVKMTTEAGSGHLTSSLSAVELVVGLMFGGLFRYQVHEPEYINNDRLIFSKGHASPLLYSVWAMAGAMEADELMILRKFESRLQGHPTRDFPWVEAATGSLGQGLSMGVGMSLAAKMDNLSYKTYVLLGDSEMAEGQNWEALQLASYYKLNNLVGIVDVNRLGQRGETMYGHDTKRLGGMIESFGWHVLMVENGHSLDEILHVYESLESMTDKPVMVVAKTMKGKGVSFLENKEGWHGKVLNEEESQKALEEIGEVDESMRGEVSEPTVVNDLNSIRSDLSPTNELFLAGGEEFPTKSDPELELDEVDTPDDYKKPLATRKAYGHALVEMYPKYPQMVVLDGEMSNSTFAETFKWRYPERFLEMFIAEQNMVSVAVGLALRGKMPWVSTFASFFTRAVDQIRLAQYNESGVNFVGSHVGVSIGEDGPTQMGLEDIAIFRAILDSVVVYPADHVAQEKLAIAMAELPGICYMRTTKLEVGPLYEPHEEFVIGGSKTLRQSIEDKVTVVGAGVTLYEALKAYDLLKKKEILIRVIDLYSIKPLDVDVLVKACKETRALIVVEDHFAEGGMAEAVRSALIYEITPIHSLAVRKMPRSGSTSKLMRFEEIDADAIVEKIEGVLI